MKNSLELYIPKFIIHRQGVIRDIDIDFSEDYNKNKIRQYDRHCNFEVFNVKRITRRVEKYTSENVKMQEYVPTKSCIVTFKSQILPKYITPVLAL